MTLRTAMLLILTNKPFIKVRHGFLMGT